ncbi:Isochorismatase-like protein [Staphylotrichum tortipilum]|uniref:Isochorismatase-like protein n=1 Tax=Staphylotrichum tortipilum TaxID=2831512 RepID=A0AAN6MHN2_9PEZI|nr:Isochorismatase-like protein [Staphylotrichum longicolle]
MATALFVIDIQNDLATDPTTRIPHADRITAAGRRILSAARGVTKPSTGTPELIIFVQHEEKPEDGPLVPGSAPWGLVFEPQLGAACERLVAKQTRDTFESNPALDFELKKLGVSSIIAFGIQSECCVESTCNGALAAGLEVTLLSGAHSTYSDSSSGKSAVQIEREVEERLRKKGAQVMPWEDAVAAWENAEK